jgi:hypothetical protein
MGSLEIVIQNLNLLIFSRVFRHMYSFSPHVLGFVRSIYVFMSSIMIISVAI